MWNCRARYLRLDASLGFDITTSSGAPNVNTSSSDSKRDAVMGLRGRVTINENWFIPLYGEIGTGQSDRTWQAFAGFGYEFGRSELVLGYRHMDWSFDDTGLIADIAFSGPLFGFTYRF